MNPYTRVYASIDLDAVIFNMLSIQKNLQPGTGIIGVVKADGYGHGAVPVAKAAAPFVRGYAVATADEAVNLQEHGITKPILILGVTHPSRYQDLIDREIRPAIFTKEQAGPLSDMAAAQGKRAKIHLAVDTGMSRIGMSPDEAGAGVAAGIAAMPGIEIEGMFTHFAKADEADQSSAKKQEDRYLHFTERLKKRGVKIPIHHISNSAAAISLPQAHLQLVRVGISMYGMYPSGEVDHSGVPLKPVMGLKSFITFVKTIPAGTEVSYGGTFRTTRDTRIATISAGYGDGYPRGLSNKGHVLIHGQRAPILGRICMDQFMADVTDIPNAGAGAEATLIGTDGMERITMEDIASLSGGFHYELACDIGKRVPRVYYREGKIVGTKDYFHDIYGDFL